MNIIVASRNPVKVGDVRQAFSSHFPSASLELIPIDVESGVSEQPDTDQETLFASVAARASANLIPRHYI